MTDKTITGWLIVDWRKGKHRTRKSKPTGSDLGSNELLAKLEIDVHVPEVEIPDLAVEIDVPEPHVRAATLEALDEEQLPGWTDIANDIIDSKSSIPDPSDLATFRGVVDQISMNVLTDTNTRPEPNQVRDYVAETMKAVSEGEEADLQ